MVAYDRARLRRFELVQRSLIGRLSKRCSLCCDGICVGLIDLRAVHIANHKGNMDQDENTSSRRGQWRKPGETPTARTS